MGYQITFKPTAEKMADYKPWNEEKYKASDEESYCDSFKRELIHYCMKPHDEMVATISKKISDTLDMIAAYQRRIARANSYFEWKNDEDKVVWFSGWEYSRPPMLDAEGNKKATLDRLAMLCDVVKTPDYFDEGERFYSKWNEIEEFVNCFADTAYELANHEIIEDLREFEVTYDEDGNEIVGSKPDDDESDESLEDKE